MGISTGCCSLGDKYCHPEYPQENQTESTNQKLSDKPTELEVSKLYVATFNRAPDSEGLNYWKNISNLNIEEISKSFFDQNETKKIYPDSISNREFITATYKNLFNREPDLDGLEYWEKDLNNETYSKDVFIQTLINGAKGDDASILENKASAGVSFANANINDSNLSFSIIEDITADKSSLISAKDKILGYNK
ncbi:Chitinase [hydrothermal vent metagenome]|uniref:Chitinase n=1 Tax=hydrothermal vent metagenome TaxID=652676 RepID=A0A1W1C6A3_9ZZZZ